MSSYVYITPSDPPDMCPGFVPKPEDIYNTQTNTISISGVI